MNDSDSPQGRMETDERDSCEHVCPDCGATFFDDDYENGDSCMPCIEKWFDEVIVEIRPFIPAFIRILDTKGNQP